MTGRTALTASQAFPEALPLPDGYPRHQPGPGQLRAAIRACVGDRSWAELSWAELIEGLLAVGRTDVPLARLVEGHVDAVRILAQAGRESEPGALYGVWASRSRRSGIAATPAGPDRANPDRANPDRSNRDRATGAPSRLQLTGTLRFASGTGVVDRALVPVWLDDDHHRLLDLDVRELSVDTRAWKTSAMEVSASHTVELDLTVDAEPAAVGPVDFYLARPAFFPGGVGVASCWAGGAARIADLIRQRPASGWSEPGLNRLGEIGVQLVTAAAVLRSTAALLDASAPDADVPWQAIATEARAAVAAATTTVIAESRRIAGAAGLAHDEDLTRGLHDLDLYVLQQNLDADRAFLARCSLA